MKLLIADDHQTVRLGVSITLQHKFPGFEITEAGNGTAVIRELKKNAIDLLILDLLMPETNSIEIVENALRIKPDIKIIILTAKPEHIFAYRYFRAGVHGFVEKTENIELLVKAVGRVLSGKKFMSDSLLEVLAGASISGHTPDNPFQLLSNREFEIVHHLIFGLKPSEICSVMNIQPSTITTYKKRIFEKLNVRNILELNSLAIEYGVR